MNLAEYLLLAAASAFWPLLVTIVVVVLRTDRPVRLLAAFLAGGLMACISVGLVLVLAFEDSHFVSHDRRTLGPILSIVVGSLSLIAAAGVLRVQSRPRRHDRPSRWRPERFVGNAKLAFAAGFLLDLVPGFFPFVALTRIAQADYSVPASAVLVVCFYLIMFLPVEIPLGAYVAVPERTVSTVQRLNAWLDRNAQRIAAGVLGVVGAWLVVSGLFQL